MMKVLGICGGNGVVLHPFKKYLIGNIEPRACFHSAGEKQWNSNFDCFTQTDFYSNDVRSYNPDVIVGAPDCGHSSILAYSRAKKLSDPKENKSLNLYIRGIQLFKPNFFLLENLPALLKGYTEEELKNVFSDYNLIFNTCPVSYLGNSQITRIRLILIGVKKGINEKIASRFIIRNKKQYELKTSIELVGDLEYPNKKLCHIREKHSEIITIYAGKKLRLDEIQAKWLFEFPDSKRWVVEDRKFTTAPGVYRNLPDEYPLTARKANRQFNHEGLMMTPRELARIQGIPDKFKLYYDKKNKGYWINKGRVTVAKTPPYEVGLWFFKRLKKLYIKGLI